MDYRDLLQLAGALGTMLIVLGLAGSLASLLLKRFSPRMLLVTVVGFGLCVAAGVPPDLSSLAATFPSLGAGNGPAPGH
ncbi:MAG: hypothetical protein Kow0069_05030 [Promethearchaeota archaeon]